MAWEINKNWKTEIKKSTKKSCKIVLK